MSRVPICEDVLVRAVEYCRWSNMRFGQLIINAVRERLEQNGVTIRTDTNLRSYPYELREARAKAAIEQTLFYMENGALEEALTAFIDKHTARHEALNKMVQDAVADGTYFSVPDNFQSGEMK